MEFLFLFLMIALMAFAAVNVSYALIMVVVMLLQAVMKLLVVPLLQMTGKLLSLPFHALGWLLRGGQAVDPFAPPRRNTRCDPRRGPGRRLQGGGMHPQQPAYRPLLPPLRQEPDPGMS